MKRKAEKPQAAPVSAFAARKARQQQVQVTAPLAQPTQTELVAEPPPKRPRRSLDEATAAKVDSEEDHGRRRSKRQATRQSTAKVTEPTTARTERATRGATKKIATANGSNSKPQDDESQETSFSDEGSEEQEVDGEDNGVAAISIGGDEDGYESPADMPVQTLNFPLSKTRLKKSDIVYSDEHTLCVRIKEKMSLVLIGQYDLWVKRGVISLMGAKLHPSPRVYRVYAPSTHSLPVVKCVAGVDGEAEVEFKSCHTGITRLRELSPLYQRAWNSKSSPTDRLTLKGNSNFTRRTFSVRAHCTLKNSGVQLSRRYLNVGGDFKYLSADLRLRNTDGVAFLDLDPGQPEFSPMGQISLAHLRSPVFGPPFTHPALNNAQDGSVIRAHHIGATSPKDDPDHYVLAATDLMSRYRALLASFPQCPLIINYPGWIFGLGLEVATWLVRSLGLSDVVYMSEKGPTEVVEPLSQATREVNIPLTILPSQPTDFVSRSSAQLRSMQMQSYFHMSQPKEVNNPLWLAEPMSRVRPFRVHYAGPRQGIYGVMVMGSQIHPDLLCESLEGAVVAIVAVESPNAIQGIQRLSTSEGIVADGPMDRDLDIDMGETSNGPNKLDSLARSTLEPIITRTYKESLPYLFAGEGSSSPLDPKTSYSVGLAIARSINTSSHQLELVTPIPGERICEVLERGHGIILVRGLLDNPNWAISEDYYAARAAEKEYRQSVEKSKSSNSEENPDVQARVLSGLKDRIQRAKNVPWMTVIENHSRRNQDTVQREKSLWKLRKKAYPDSESEAGY